MENKKIFIIGSRKFSNEIQIMVKKMKDQGIEALLPVNKDSIELSYEEEKEALFDAFRKIDECKKVFVYAKDGYVGKTGCIEIAFAYAKNYPIYSLEKTEENSAQAMITKVVGNDISAL